MAMPCTVVNVALEPGPSAEPTAPVPARVATAAPASNEYHVALENLPTSQAVHPAVPVGRLLYAPAGHVVHAADVLAAARVWQPFLSGPDHETPCLPPDR